MEAFETQPPLHLQQPVDEVPFDLAGTVLTVVGGRSEELQNLVVAIHR
jgi:hypothetical protein